MKPVHDDSGKTKFLYENIPCSMEEFFEQELINPHAFEYLKDLFMAIFEKAELKTIDDSKQK